MNKGILKIYWKKGWISFFISAFCFLYLLKFSWLKWGDLIVDIGREMYVPLQIISRQKLLYRDIYYLYGPFPPYFNALLFKIFGVHIRSLIISGIISACSVSLLLYKISRISLSIFYSTFTVVTFLFVFCFGQYVFLNNYNFILPYSYSATYCILFSLSALYFFYLSFLKNLRFKSAYCLAAILTFLCRLEVGAMLVISLTPAIAILNIKSKESSKKIFSDVFIYIFLPVFFAFLVNALFFLKTGSLIKKTNLAEVFFSNLNTKATFTATLTGTKEAFLNMMVMLKVFLYYIFYAFLFVTLGLIVNYIWRQSLRLKRMAFLALIGLIFIWISHIFFKRFLHYSLQFRPLPLICLLTIFFTFGQFKRRMPRHEQLFIITLSIFSLFMLSRMLLNVWAGHYGFYLVIPGLLVYYVFFFRLLPFFIESPQSRISFNLGFLFIFTLFILSHFQISRYCYRNTTLKVSSPRGTLYFFNNNYNLVCKEFIEFLMVNTDKNDTLAVVPEGVAINFLSQIENPLYYYSYLPIELPMEHVEDEIIADMESKHLGYIALVQRETSEYGPAVFGWDYARKFGSYIAKNYILYKQFGAFPFTSPKFGIALFKRKS